jgi:hypothetical protein
MSSNGWLIWWMGGRDVIFAYTKSEEHYGRLSLFQHIPPVNITNTNPLVICF